MADFFKKVTPQKGKKESKGGHFTVWVDDTELIEAMRQVSEDMPDIIDDVLQRRINQQVGAMKKWLKAEAGALANVKVPGDSFHPEPSVHAYVKIANSLTGYRYRPMGYLVGSEPFLEGVEGSRGVKLAQLHYEGKTAFNYPAMLPEVVRSSTRAWVMGTHGRVKPGKHGFLGDPIMGNTEKHPGFDTKDFLQPIYEGLIDKFAEDWVDKILAKYPGAESVRSGTSFQYSVLPMPKRRGY
tara:strand:- start:7896 stop:8615 length:720 start_codon:yes stop_codon:yes gene_type:complete